MDKTLDQLIADMRASERITDSGTVGFHPVEVREAYVALQATMDDMVRLSGTIALQIKAVSIAFQPEYPAICDAVLLQACTLLDHVQTGRRNSAAGTNCIPHLLRSLEALRNELIELRPVA